MPTIEFGSRTVANDMRDKVEEYLSRADDRRELTVKLKSSTPDKIVERVKEEAFGSREQRSRGAGKAKLSDKEQRSLERQHDTFTWQQHGFEAMSVKAAMQEEGVTEWMDYYEPGEGVDSAIGKLREKKKSAQQHGASIGTESMRTDMEEVNNTGRRSNQAERAQAQQAKRAKRPAVVETDTEAIDFLREEQRFSDSDVFDITVSGQGPTLDASGRDLDLLHERNEARSAHARLMDDLKAANITKDPIAWAQNPSSMDFPTVDTLKPEKVHDRRSERARDVDNQELAPVADTRQEWATNPDEFDWPDVDTPEDADDMDMLENGDEIGGMGGFGNAEGGTTDANPGEKADKPGSSGGESRALDEMDDIDAMRIGKEVSGSMNDMDKSLKDVPNF